MHSEALKVIEISDNIKSFLSHYYFLIIKLSNLSKLREYQIFFHFEAFIGIEISKNFEFIFGRIFLCFEAIKSSKS